MWYHAMTSIDLARDRAREAESEAARWRYEHELARRVAATAGPGPFRRTLAGAMRGFSDVTSMVADAACAAATRIEGRTA